jgi:hypothetical protein
VIEQLQATRCQQSHNLRRIASVEPPIRGENWRDRLRDGLSWLFPGPLLLVYE